MPSLDTLLTTIPGARLVLPSGDHAAEAAARAVRFETVSTDSRTLAEGALFVGLSGPRFDGAAFVQAAAQRGACAALITAGSEPTITTAMPLVVVPDALLALQQWARYWRSLWQGCCVAVTGSNGKTTVKHMIQSLAQQALGHGAVWATPGNLNNHIGVPLSVLGLRPEHRFAVFELGMNHPDEIAALANIAQPHVALVNNAQREHQEFMKSVTAVAQENGAVFSALHSGGAAIFPRDPEHEQIWISQTRDLQGRQIRFGFATTPAGSSFKGEEVLGRWIDSEQTIPNLQICFPDGEAIELLPKGLGVHFALNLIAAAACGYAAGIAPSAIAQALSAFEPVSGRGRTMTLDGGGTLVDDTYNANPDSVRAAIEALARMRAPRALVLGDMGEVGDAGPEFHQEVLHYAADHQLDAIWLHGEAMAAAHEQTKVGHHVAEVQALITEVQQWVRMQQGQRHPPSLWVKGSRFMKMERIVQAIAHAQEGQTACC